MPKKHVILIHGGSCWQTRAEYLADLKASEFFPGTPRAGWHQQLQKDLGAGYKVWLPDMPNWQNAHYEEWQIWFEKVLAVAGPDPVVIGHSLGGIFLIKYFAETLNPPKIRAMFLVGTPYRTKAQDPDFGDFALKREPKSLTKLGAKIHFYHSQDDPIVAFADVKKYQTALPDVVIKKYPARGHFIQNHFPEIARAVRAVF